LFLAPENNGKNRQKSSLKKCVFVNSALNIQCHVIKNTLLQTAFSAILPTGILFLEVAKEIVMNRASIIKNKHSITFTPKNQNSSFCFLHS